MVVQVTLAGLMAGVFGMKRYMAELARARRPVPVAGKGRSGANRRSEGRPVTQDWRRLNGGNSARLAVERPRPATGWIEGYRRSCPQHHPTSHSDVGWCH